MTSTHERSELIARTFVWLAVSTLTCFVLVQLWLAVAARSPERRVRELMPAVGAQSVEAAIVYGTSGASVSHSMVDGQWLMTDRQVRTLDVADALSQQQRDYDTLVSRMRAAAAEEDSV